MIGAALLLRTFHNLTTIDLGFRPAGVLVAELDLFTYARSSVQSPEAGTRKVEAIEGILRSLDGYVQRSANARDRRLTETAGQVGEGIVRGGVPDPLHGEELRGVAGSRGQS